MILILAVLGVSVYFIFHNVATFLAVNEPIGADYLVIEGWLGKKELEQAHQMFVAGEYKLAVVSGGPRKDGFNSSLPNYAERGRQYLLSKGFPKEKLFAAPAPYSAQERTFMSAVTLREWFTDQGIVVQSLDIFTGDVHSRRSRELYRLVFGEQVDIGVYASKPNGFELNRWWQSSDGAKSVAAELLGWLLVKCCFNPGQSGSHHEN